MEENNNEKISVSGADLLKDVVADEKAAKTAPKDTEKDKKDKEKIAELNREKIQITSNIERLKTDREYIISSPAFLSLCLY